MAVVPILFVIQICGSHKVWGSAAGTGPWVQHLSQRPEFISQNKAEYHSTDELFSSLLEMSKACPHVHSQWAIMRDGPRISSKPGRGFAHVEGQPKLLVLSLTHNAKLRAEAKRKGRVIGRRKRVVAVFGEHGRELIGPELALGIVQRYCTSRRHAHALIKMELTLLPLVNEAGRRMVERGDECRRLNWRGVDLNRNYMVGWGKWDADTVAAEEKAGGGALSEWESQIVDGIVAKVKPAAYVSVHSGGRAILVPWDSGSGATGRAAHVARQVAAAHCRTCGVGVASDLFGYRAYGTAVDHMFGIRRVPFACTLEIWESSGSCREMFNPRTQLLFRQVVHNWTGALETIAAEVGDIQSAQNLSSWWPPAQRLTFIEADVGIPHEELGAWGFLFVLVLFSMMAIMYRRKCVCNLKQQPRRTSGEYRAEPFFRSD